MFALSQAISRVSLARSGFALETVRNATKKAGGSTTNGRGSAGRRLGLKKTGGYGLMALHFACSKCLYLLLFFRQPVISGNILIRQRGQKYRPGENVGMGKDHTLWALTDGWCHFTDQIINREKRKVCNVVQFDPNEVSRMKHAQKLIEQQERDILISQRAAAPPPDFSSTSA